MKGVRECWPGGLVRILGGAAKWHFRSITVPSLSRTWRTARSRTWRTRTPRWRSGPCTSPPSWRRRTLSSCSPPPPLTLSLLWPSCTVCCVLLCIPSWQISKLSIDVCGVYLDAKDISIDPFIYVCLCMSMSTFYINTRYCPFLINKMRPYKMLMLDMLRKYQLVSRRLSCHNKCLHKCFSST